MAGAGIKGSMAWLAFALKHRSTRQASFSICRRRQCPCVPISFHWHGDAGSVRSTGTMAQACKGRPRSRGTCAGADASPRKLGRSGHGAQRTRQREEAVCSSRCAHCCYSPSRRGRFFIRGLLAISLTRGADASRRVGAVHRRLLGCSRLARRRGTRGAARRQCGPVFAHSEVLHRCNGKQVLQRQLRCLAEDAAVLPVFLPQGVGAEARAQGRDEEQRRGLP